MKKLGKLTKKNVDQLGEESKDAKIQRIAKMSSFDEKRKAIGSDKELNLVPDDLLKIFGNKEMVKNYNRFSQTECKKDSEVEEAWRALQESREPGKEQKKRALLLAWLQDNMVMTPKFKTSCTALCFSKTRTKQLKWLTTKEVLDKHGQEEGLQMIKEGSLLVRKNPANNKFFQFLSAEDFMTLDVKKQEELKVSGTSKVTDTQWRAITSSIKDVDLACLDGDLDNFGMQGPGDEFNFDDDDKVMLPEAVAPKPKNPVKASPEERVLNFDNQKTMPKVKYMHSVLTKDAQYVQSLVTYTQSSLMWSHLFQLLFDLCFHIMMSYILLRLRAKPTDKEVSKYKALVKDLKIIIEKFDKHIISESLSLNDVKKLLIKAVALHRQVKDMQGKGDAKSVAGSKAK
jgi:hypothetical protein